MKIHKSRPKSPQEQERVKRVPEKPSGIEKIESMDRAIDRLVSPAGTSYELSRKRMVYGLSEDEVKVVEGS